MSFLTSFVLLRNGHEKHVFALYGNQPVYSILGLPVARAGMARNRGTNLEELLASTKPPAEAETAPKADEQ